MHSEVVLVSRGVVLLRALTVGLITFTGFDGHQNMLHLQIPSITDNWEYLVAGQSTIHNLLITMHREHTQLITYLSVARPQPLPSEACPLLARKA